MADLLIDHQGVPTAPSSGKSVIFPDNNSGQIIRYSSAGRAWGRDRNWSTADQAPAASTDVYITASDLLIPSFGMQAGMRFLWQIAASKTNASTAAAIWVVRIGSARTTSDTARLTITMGTQSAAIDVGIIELMMTVRANGAAGSLQGMVTIAHSAATNTGFGLPAVAVATGIDMTSYAGLYVGLSLNTGSSAVWTLTQVQSEVDY